jgi:hypothetical protein
MFRSLLVATNRPDIAYLIPLEPSPTSVKPAQLDRICLVTELLGEIEFGLT